jgi:hypothetical protein
MIKKNLPSNSMAQASLTSLGPFVPLVVRTPAPSVVVPSVVVPSSSCVVIDVVVRVEMGIVVGVAIN